MQHIIRSFPNGLRVILNQTDMPTLTVAVRVNSGVSHERKKNEGITALIEKLLSYGTSSYPSKNSLLGKIKSFGGILSTSTHLDAVEICITCLASEMKEAINVLSEIVFESEFKRFDIQACQKLVANSFEESKSQPSLLVHDALRAIMFPRCGLGKGIWGRNSSIAKIERRDIVEYWANVLHPKNMVFTVTGNTEFDIVYDIVMKDFYSRFMKTKGRALKPARQELLKVGDRRENVVSKKLFQTRVNLGFHSPSISGEDYAAVCLGVYIMKNKINEWIADFDGIYSLECSMRSWEKNGMLYITFAVDKGKEELATAEIAKAIGDFFTNGMTVPEFESLRSQFMTFYASTYENSKALGRMSAKQLVCRKTEFSLMGELKLTGELSFKKCLFELARAFKSSCFAAVVGRIPDDVSPVRAFEKNFVVN